LPLADARHEYRRAKGSHWKQWGILKRKSYCKETRVPLPLHAMKVHCPYRLNPPENAPPRSLSTPPPDDQREGRIHICLLTPSFLLWPYNFINLNLMGLDHY
jgi:hypothetical protein